MRYIKIMEVLIKDKFRTYEVITNNGIFVVKTPQTKVTPTTALKYASHWLKMQHNVSDVKIVAVKGVE